MKISQLSLLFLWIFVSKVTGQFQSRVNILDEVSIQDNATLVNYTSDRRPIYFVNKTITGPASSMNWQHISAFIENGFGFIMEWLPATPDAFVGQIMAINKGMDNEFSIRIEDSPKSSGTIFRQRMVVNIPKASKHVVFDLIGDAVINTGELWQYGLTYDGRVFRFYFNCDAELAAPERDPGFFITNTSMIEIGDPRENPFLISAMWMSTNRDDGTCLDTIIPKQQNCEDIIDTGCLRELMEDIAADCEECRGSPGIMGQAGIPGMPGRNGSKGEIGEPGEPGTTGNRGPRGIQGEPGFNGADGADGAKGEKGSAGATGFSGIPGIDGSKGEKGAPGIPGEPGNKGMKGQKGSQGVEGIRGPRGRRGESGLNGDNGLNGAKGIKGERGKKGNKGDYGSTGIPGVNGEKGEQGKPGPSGESGNKGMKGQKGSQGVIGPPGPPGKPGTNASLVKSTSGDEGDTESDVPINEMPCTSGSIRHDPISPEVITICEGNEWVPYQIEPRLGQDKPLSADSCKQIMEFLNHTCTECLPKSGVYLIKHLQIHCDMETDGGGWTLVWQHSYLESLPLSTKMYYFSEYYKSCTTYGSGWCNVPNKKRFNPSEQMIVAYNNKEIVYAYKGIFNFNIDHDWTGGILVNFTKIIDKCDLVQSINVQPAPSINSISGDDRLFGLAFAKQTPCNYWKNSDTIYGRFESPIDARFSDCSQLPSLQKGQQTIAIFVR